MTTGQTPSADEVRRAQQPDFHHIDMFDKFIPSYELPPSVQLRLYRPEDNQSQFAVWAHFISQR